MSRLLFITQKLDRNDAVLGGIHSWVQELAKRFEDVHVICLQEGEYSLPANVHVHTLGKEAGTSRLERVRRFFTYISEHRSEYDVVLVHMNQEYILLAGWLWHLYGKRVYMWRNHYAGTFLTDIAASLCDKVFCTSNSSYTAHYPQTVIMPVGINTDIFKPREGIERKNNSILFLARIAPSKRVEVFIEALRVLAEKGVAYSACVVGSALPQDEGYYRKLQKSAEGLPIEFLPAVPNTETPAVYSAHEIFVNCSPSGMYDRTLFESALCGCVPIAQSQDWKELMGSEVAFNGSASSLAQTIERVLQGETSILQEQIRTKASAHSLSHLADKLKSEMS